MSPKPAVGRIVHYVSRGSADGAFVPEHRAAVVTDVHNERVVSLCVLNPTGLYFDIGVYQDEDDKLGGTWHWPERE